MVAGFISLAEPPNVPADVSSVARVAAVLLNMEVASTSPGILATGISISPQPVLIEIDSGIHIVLLYAPILVSITFQTSTPPPPTGLALAGGDSGGLTGGVAGGVTAGVLDGAGVGDGGGDVGTGVLDGSGVGEGVIGGVSEGDGVGEGYGDPTGTDTEGVGAGVLEAAGVVEGAGGVDIDGVGDGNGESGTGAGEAGIREIEGDGVIGIGDAEGGGGTYGVVPTANDTIASSTKGSISVS